MAIKVTGRPANDGEHPIGDGAQESERQMRSRALETRTVSRDTGPRSPSPHMSPDLERQRIRALLHRATVAMLVTTDDRGFQAGRPMLPLFLENDPHIYFLTHQDSRKVRQIAERPHVAITIISEDAYFFALGCASVLRDAELIRRLWHPSYRAWFPSGRDDRNATALRVVVGTVNYWEPPRTQVRRLFRALKAFATGRAVETPMKTVDGLS